MNLCSQRIVAKISRDMFTLEGTKIRGLHKLSCLVSADRVRTTSSSSATSKPKPKVFHFAGSTSSSCYSGPAVCRPNACASSSPEIGNVLFIFKRYNASEKQTSGASDEKKSIVQSKESPYAHLTVGQKVKEAGKDASYTVVIIAGIAVTGLMFYMIGKELLSSQSPSGVYGDALKKCQASMEVTAALGEPIKGYGETTRRGRRRHVSHTEFEVNGVPHMRMRFYVEGPYKKATVHVEVQKDEGGKYQYRYLVVETEGYPHRTFILEDNR